MVFRFTDPRPDLGFSEYWALPQSEKLRLQAEAHKQNSGTLSNAYSELRADWIAVVGDEVVCHGRLYRIPDCEQVTEAARQCDRVPYIFIQTVILTASS